MAMVNPIINLANVKDSRWLTLEVCREYTRNKCTRTENECKFAHPPPNVEVQNGRVTCCFDSIKGKCQRKDPPCKYLHPPQHLREQLLQNGRNNLILRNLQLQAMATSGLQPLVPPNMFPATVAPPYVMQGPTAFNPYLNPGLPVTGAGGMPGGLMQTIDSTASTGTVPGIVHASALPTQKVPRADRLEPATSSNGSEGSSHWPGSYVDSVPYSSQYSPVYFQPQVVEVLTTGKKRPRDPADDLVLGGMTTSSGMPGVVPIKRPAFGMDSKMGMQAMYQPTNPNSAAYQQAALAMQHGLQSYVPVSLAGHHPTVPRF